MKHLRKFNEGVHTQLRNSDEARIIINKYYNVVDEVTTSYSAFSMVNFLVEADDFLQRMSEHDGYIAGNYYRDTDHIREDINKLYSLSPHVYVCPYWSTRTEKDIECGDVYADTLYVPYIEGISGKIGEDGKMQVIMSEFEFLNADEIGVSTSYGNVSSKSGEDYIRIWWD
jgi:hypothetical protein